MIDTGKTFREGALRWFTHFGISSLDAIVLTHHHMDAAAGLDDVRGFQSLHPSYKGVGRPKRIPVPVYLSQFCHDCVQSQFPWLFPKKQDTPEVTPLNDGKPIVHRDVASFDVHIFQDYVPMDIEGLKITPLPVWHGDDLISHGFSFSISTKETQSDGSPKTINVVYLSDISRMVPETLTYILEKLPPTDILVVDALLWHSENPVHFNMDQALALRDQIQPRVSTYFVGMNCDSFFLHDEMNAYLQKKYATESGSTVQLAHDGLAIDI